MKQKMWRKEENMGRDKEKIRKGMYSPRFEHDNCGRGAVVNIRGRKTHQTVEDALPATVTQRPFRWDQRTPSSVFTARPPMLLRVCTLFARAG